MKIFIPVLILLPLLTFILKAFSPRLVSTGTLKLTKYPLIITSLVTIVLLVSTFFANNYHQQILFSLASFSEVALDFRAQFEINNLTLLIAGIFALLSLFLLLFSQELNADNRVLFRRLAFMAVCTTSLYTVLFSLNFIFLLIGAFLFDVTLFLFVQLKDQNFSAEFNFKYLFSTDFLLLIAILLYSVSSQTFLIPMVGEPGTVSNTVKRMPMLLPLLVLTGLLLRVGFFPFPRWIDKSQSGESCGFYTFTMISFSAISIVVFMKYLLIIPDEWRMVGALVSLIGAGFYTVEAFQTSDMAERILKTIGSITGFVFFGIGCNVVPESIFIFTSQVLGLYFLINFYTGERPADGRLHPPEPKKLHKIITGLAIVFWILSSGGTPLFVGFPLRIAIGTKILHANLNYVALYALLILFMITYLLQYFVFWRFAVNQKNEVQPSKVSISLFMGLFLIIIGNLNMLYTGGHLNPILRPYLLLDFISKPAGEFGIDWTNPLVIVFGILSALGLVIGYLLRNNYRLVPSAPFFSRINHFYQIIGVNPMHRLAEFLLYSDRKVFPRARLQGVSFSQVISQKVLTFESHWLDRMSKITNFIYDMLNRPNLENCRRHALGIALLLSILIAFLIILFLI